MIFPRPSFMLNPVTNFWEGREGLAPVAIVNHITSGGRAATLAWFKDSAGGQAVSSNYLVCRNGDVIEIVPPGSTAWANGIAQNPDMTLPWLKAALGAGINPNRVTISIEHEGFTGQPLPEVQYQASLGLQRWLCQAFSIPADRTHIIGHSQINPVQKPYCPGSAYPWARLIADLSDVKTENVPTPVQDAWHCSVPNHDFWVTNDQGFWSHYQQHGGTIAFGLPISGAFTSHNIDGSSDNGRVVQAFERTILAAYPENQPPYAVQGLLITDPAYAAILAEALTPNH